MHAIYVPLKTDVKAALFTLAEREARDPRRQAARLVQEGLIRAGVLAIEVTNYQEVGTTIAGREPASAATA